MKLDKKTYQLFIGEKVFDVEYRGNVYCVDCEYESIAEETIDIDKFPNDLIIRIHSKTGFNSYLFYESELLKVDNKLRVVLICNQPNKYWEGKYGLSTLLMQLVETVNLTQNLTADPETLNVEEDWKYLEVYDDITGLHTIKKIQETVSEKLNKEIRQTELILSGAVWKKDYEKSEKLFSTELLYPLFRKMKFIDVRYTHGTKEYGKDFTMSEPTNFGNLRHYGVQVKAGNMRGNVNSDIDEILGQIDDAFSMPYYEITANEERRISTFIIAISGKFTENAKEKIANKIAPSLRSSVYMIDREKILELIERYWK